MRILIAFLTAITTAAMAQAPAPQAPPQEIPDATQPLSGTLFFSREQRDRLDRARKRGDVIDESGAVAPDAPPVITGFLRRSDGKTTVWVDGKSYSDRNPKLVQRVQSNDVGGEAKNNIKILGALDSPGSDRKAKKTRKAAPAKPAISKPAGADKKP